MPRRSPIIRTRWRRAKNSWLLAEDSYGMGQWQAALAFAERDREIGQKIGAQGRVAWAECSFAYSYHGLGNLAAALGCAVPSTRRSHWPNASATIAWPSWYGPSALVLPPTWATTNRRSRTWTGLARALERPATSRCICGPMERWAISTGSVRTGSGHWICAPSSNVCWAIGQMPCTLPLAWDWAGSTN